MLSPPEFIAAKRDGGEHAPEEIAAWIDRYARDQLPDYQMAAWAMAVFWRGMTAAETSALTHSMLHSGMVMEWGDGPPVVDKHSTGGIGDKVSLILAPLLACCGLRVPMISGRGLGPTGGTLDKLEAIPGFQSQLSSDTIQRIANECGCVIAGASEQIAPADKRLYGLRDVTGTVPCIPLITASIMSKKLAEGLDALVLDVKWGSGAFMKSLERARALARSLADTGRAMGVTTTALITDMNQPLGRSIGNANEVDESVDCLRGAGPADLRDLTIELGVELLISAGLAQPHQRTDARQQLNRALDSGQAYEKFAEFVRAQGGDPEAPRQLAPAVDVPSVRDGFVTAVDAERLGYTIIDLGGGRRQKTDAVDHAVGIEMLVRIGDPITRGQPLAQLRARTADDRERGAKAIREAIRIGESPVTMPELIVERCSEQGP